MWLNLNIDEDGEQFHEVEVPETPDDFGIFAFSWSKENGIGLTQTSYSTVRPIDFYCEVPEEIRQINMVLLRHREIPVFIVL